MGVCKVYDLKNESELVMVHSEERENRRKEQELQPDEISQIEEMDPVTVKSICFSLAEFVITIASGLIFYIWISQVLEHARGYSAIGGEVFAACAVSIAVFYVIEAIGEWLWTKKD